jgi:hypothetical protein
MKNVERKIPRLTLASDRQRNHCRFLRERQGTSLRSFGRLEPVASANPLSYFFPEPYPTCQAAILGLAEE